MLLTLLFWTVLGILSLVFISAIVATLRRGSQNAQNQGANGEEIAPIYASGVFSLIRKSPRNEILTREPSLAEIQAILALPEATAIANGSAQQYLDEWRRMANISINNIEKGDREGVQTYRYRVPEKCQDCCSMFAGDAYVTREQLHKHAELIPPFHLGCGCELLARQAWSPGTDTASWTPILPDKGKYSTPDWRRVVNL